MVVAQWRCRRVCATQDPGGVVEQREHASVLGLEAAPLGVAQALLGEAEGREVGEHRPRSRETLGEPRPERAERACRLALGTHGGDRLAQDPVALGVALGRAERGDEDLGLATTEVMASGRVERGALEPLGERAQREPQPHADLACVERALPAWREVAGEREAARGPRALLPGAPGDVQEREAVLVDERGDDARLVHGAERARRRVRREQEQLLVGGGARGLDDDLDVRRTSGAQLGQELEAVDDLVGPVARGHGPERQ